MCKHVTSCNFQRKANKIFNENKDVNHILQKSGNDRHFLQIMSFFCRAKKKRRNLTMCTETKLAVTHRAHGRGSGVFSLPLCQHVKISRMHASLAFHLKSKRCGRTGSQLPLVSLRAELATARASPIMLASPSPLKSSSHSVISSPPQVSVSLSF